MTGIGAPLRLHITLPPVWRIVPSAEWSSELIGRNQAHHADLGVTVRAPALLATSFAAVAAEDEAAASVRAGDVSAADYLLIAGLTVTVLAADEVPETLRADGEPFVTRRQLAIGDSDVWFVVGTHVRVRPEYDAAALVSVSTPNLEQAAEIIAGFAAVADTVRFTPAGGSSWGIMA